ncbi:hypothetical protein BIWAKO_05924 [Bosea sp. BIWAKO-01]|nr:hypothetical protein BIWAKO_05924 [Bosea sp. BIWAKO-01]
MRQLWNEFLENPIWLGLLAITAIGVLIMASYVCDAAWRIWHRMLGIRDD